MKIQLRVHLDQPLLVDDAAVRLPLVEPLLSQLRAQPYLGGAIEITDDGREPLVIHDDLEQLVPRLCVMSLARLDLGEPVTVPLFTDAVSVLLSPQGAALDIVAPGERRETFPLAAALAELEACGARFVRLIELNFADDTSRQMKLAALQVELGRREDARDADAPFMELPLVPDDELPRD